MAILNDINSFGQMITNLSRPTQNSDSSDMVNGVDTNFLYCDGIANIINDLPTNTNILNDYDNVVYHCDLFAYGKNTQKEIDKKLADERIYEPNKDKRIYICKDGVTTKFYIDSFIIKSQYGNHQNPVNVATYTVELTIKESFSCILSHELDVLGTLSGYDSYLQRPYWLEIWFTGFDKKNGLPVERIPLPNGEDSIIYEGYFSKMESHIESSGTTWKATFFPNYSALTQKNTNLLNVSSVLKNSGSVNLKSFLEKCAEDMFKRFLKQITKEEDEAGRKKIRSFYNDFSNKSKNQSENPTSPTGIVQGSLTENLSNEQKDIAEQLLSGTKNNGFISFKLKDKDGNDFTGAENIISNLDSSTNDSEKKSEKQNSDKTILFTTICQHFLLNTKNYSSYIAKYDIKTSLLGYYDNHPLFHHDIDIYLVEDPYMAAKLKQFDEKNQENKKHNLSDEEATEFVNECVVNGTLIKKYQYGFSGTDVSVLEIDNKFDRLFFMNALPQAAEQWNQSNISLRESGIKKVDDESEKNISVIKENENENDENVIDFNGENLEDIYASMNKKNIADAVIKYNKIPEMNNDLSDDNRRMSTTSNKEVNKKTIAATMLWKNLYLSGQLCTTSFTILGDPYWIATNSFLTSNNKNNKSKDLLDRLPTIAPNIPDYRCIFIIKSSPEQNNFYTMKNPTDYTFENALYASGIYVVVSSESIFEGGKFIQKIKGQIDVRLIKEKD